VAAAPSLVQLRVLAARAAAGDDLASALARAVGDPARVLTRPIDLVAHASDASVYRRVPRAVVRPAGEGDVRALLAVARERGVPLTFRAAGTSLSGQAVTDGILVDVSQGWDRIELLDGGARVRVQPGAIGGRVNAVLRRHGRRIGPDPASIDACMIGGILANNASGMCCGVVENAYHTLESIRFVLPRGDLVDTADRDARLPLDLREGLLALRDRVRADADLVARIRAKYRIKNTTGYALNAFLDHDAPEQILAHLLIGSEGTLGFISEAVLRTLPVLPCARTGLLLFESPAAAFAAVAPFAASGARAIEFLDDACLRAVAAEPGLGVDVAALPATAAALLVEYQCADDDALAAARIAEARVLAGVAPLRPPRFTEDAAERAVLWRVRKGLYPAAGATRRRGETVVIEDVAFPLDRLPAATAALKALFAEHGYDRALLFGHARDGNCHFVITPSFDGDAEIARYQRFMAALVALVVAHEGSLKAEHGTGRNIAPFVADEWGRDAHAVMRALKALIDPDGVLSPGVILTDDPRAHLAGLKPLPPVDAEVDRCVECGFCEPVCPSRRLTLTPRQRIVVRREAARLAATGGDPETLASLARDFQHDGIDTCAADGMCATACPVHIDTGALVKRLRADQRSPRARRLAGWIAAHLGGVERALRIALRAGRVLEVLLGARALAAIARLAGRGLGTRLPAWSRAIPRVPRRLRGTVPGAGAAAVLVPSCMTRIMGRPRGETRSAEEVMLALAARAGIELALPADRAGTCCGLAFGSKGFPDAHAATLRQLVDRMWTWSRQGAIPLVLDGSSCLGGIAGAAARLDVERRRRLARMRLVDAATFVRDELLPRLPIRPLDRTVVLHPTCASRRRDDGRALRDVAAACARAVEVPIALGCCAMAGDRGLLFPELTATAVAAERDELAGRDGVRYADNLPCELGMTQATGTPYRSFVYLVDEASRGASRCSPDPPRCGNPG